tara:strand:+ start:1414 stop:1620 length:207 start_codon:yes stop_codon:yes gene_type:complete
MNEDTLVKDVMDDMGNLQKYTQIVLKYLSDLIVENNELKAKLKAQEKQTDLANKEVKILHQRYSNYID